MTTKSEILKAVRAECLDCNKTSPEVKLCPVERCNIHPLRFGKAVGWTKADVLHAIRRKCLDCSGENAAEVRDCKITSCDLWPYRMGKDPNPSKRGFALRPKGTVPVKTPAPQGHSASRSISDVSGAPEIGNRSVDEGF